MLPSHLSGTGLTVPSLGTELLTDGSGLPTGPKREVERNLALDVRRNKVILGAWLAIKRNARTSKSQDTRKEIEAFEANVSTNLQRISRELQQRKFIFARARGISLPTANKDNTSSHPLVVVEVQSRIVNRA